MNMNEGKARGRPLLVVGVFGGVFAACLHPSDPPFPTDHLTETPSSACPFVSLKKYLLFQLDTTITFQYHHPDIPTLTVHPGYLTLVPMGGQGERSLQRPKYRDAGRSTEPTQTIDLHWFCVPFYATAFGLRALITF